MSDEKVSTDQYGRKTWNVEAYTKDSKSKKKEDKPVQKIHEVVADKSSNHLVHREKLLSSLINAIKTHTVIDPNAASSTGKRKRFGFVCPVCEYSFRDNMALIDHFNSPEHILKVTSKVRHDDEEREQLEQGINRATVDEVKGTLELLLAQMMESKDTKATMNEKIEARKRFEQKRLAKRKAKRQKKHVDSTPASTLSDMMGFAEFK